MDFVSYKIILPVGISFYTFQTLGYTIDVYRKRIKAENNFFVFALYVSFFPQLVAGPIERASRLLPQFKNLSLPNSRQIKEGFWFILWGYFLKVVIADNMARVVDKYYYDLSSTAPELFLASLAFTLQIYGDFAGYSKIARGLSKLIGIELTQNFNHPYFATSPSDFWKRWHISLSEWLRDYLYISLGGNRITKTRTYINLFLTMLIGGLWHGASFMFVAWGAYHGALLIIFKFFQSNNYCFKSPKYLSIIFMFILTFFGWIIFRADNFFMLKKIILGLNNWSEFKFSSFFISSSIWTIFFFSIVLLNDLYEERTKKHLSNIYSFLLLLLAITILGADGQNFIYFQF